MLSLEEKGPEFKYWFDAMWDIDSGSPCVPLLGALYSRCLCIFRCSPANQTPLVLRFSSPSCFALCVRACRCVSVRHQLDMMPGMKYHLPLDSAAHSGNHQVNSLGLPADPEGCWRCLLSWSSPTNGRMTDRLLTALVDSGAVCWRKCCLFLSNYSSRDLVHCEKLPGQMCV